MLAHSFHRSNQFLQLPRKHKTDICISYNVKRDDKRINWTLHESGRNVHTLRWNWKSVKEAEAWILLSSDRHHDNKHADQNLEIEHLKEAQKRGAAIIDIGDMHCAMQGKYDRRKSTLGLRDEYVCETYLDALVECAADFYSPYANNFAVIGQGNHETAILKHHETDLTERTCERMSAISGVRVCSGGYSGFVRLCFQWHTQKFERILHYFHGSGGASPMSHGTLNVRRMASWLPDADIVATGHTHSTFYVPISRCRLKKNGEIENDEQHHVNCGTYKDESGDRYGGWSVEKGMPPKPVGAVWLRIVGYHKAQKYANSTQKQLRFEFIRAV